MTPSVPNLSSMPFIHLLEQPQDRSSYRIRLQDNVLSLSSNFLCLVEQSIEMNQTSEKIDVLEK